MSKSYKDEQKEVKIMDLKNYSTGVQHIGIPTNDIDKTVEFYHKLGFESAHQTLHECSLLLGTDRVKVQNALVGGGFGGKEDMTVQHLAALLLM